MEKLKSVPESGSEGRSSRGIEDHRQIIVKFLDQVGKNETVNEKVDGETVSKIIPSVDLSPDSKGQLSDKARVTLENCRDSCKVVLQDECDLTALVALSICEAGLQGVAGFASGFEAIMKALDDNWDLLTPAVRSDRIESPTLDRFKVLQIYARDRIQTRLLNRIPLIFDEKGRFLSIEAEKIARDDQDYFIANQLRPTSKAGKDKDNGERFAEFSTVESELYTQGMVDDFIQNLEKEKLETAINCVKTLKNSVGYNGDLIEKFHEQSIQTSEALGGSGLKVMKLVYRELDQFASEAEVLLSTWFGKVGGAMEVEVDTQPGSATSVGNSVDQADLVENDESVVAVNNGSVASSDSVSNSDQAKDMVDAALVYLLRNEKSNPSIIFLLYARQLIGCSFVEILKFFNNQSTDQSLSEAARQLSSGFAAQLLDKINLEVLDKDIQSFLESIVDSDRSDQSESGDGVDTQLGSELVSGGDSTTDSSVNSANRPSADKQSGYKNHRVRNRTEALKIVSDVAKHFKNNEPANPVSDLLSRALEVSNQDFMAVLANLAGQEGE